MPIRRLLLGACFFDIGVVLIVLPWSAIWDRNYFAQVAPFLGIVITNDFVRGAVTGLGVVNVSAALAEIVAILVARRPGGPMSIAPSRITDE